MNLSFSIRGWTELSWPELVRSAGEMRFQGIELYNIFKVPEWTDKTGPFHKYTVNSTVRSLREAGLRIPCIDTSCDLSDGQTATISHVTQMLALAAELRCPYVAAWAKTDEETVVHEALRQLLPEAERLGITLLIKTTGIYSDTARLRELMNTFARDELAVLGMPTIHSATRVSVRLTVSPIWAPM